MSDKLAIYQEALEKVTRELTQKRTELASLARQTVESLESSIPGLIKNTSDLNVEISRLEKIVHSKNAEAAAKREDLQVKYSALEISLRKEYEDKKSSLDEVDRFQNERDVKYSKDLSELKLLEKNLKEKSSAANKDIDSRMSSLRKNIEDFEAYRKSEISSLESEKNKIKEDLLSTIKLKESLVNSNNELTNKLADLDNKIKEADAIISEKSATQEILNIAKEKEIKNVAREAKINEANVKLMADVNRNNARSATLDKREGELNVRDSNLKIAEASMNKE